MSNERGEVSRREFLKIAGLTGVAAGLAGGLSGVLAACGEEEAATAASSTTTAPATTASTASSTTATSAAGTTTVSTGPEAGREVRLGFVDPLTGNLAAFGIAGQYIVSKWRAVAGDGLLLGDKKKHPITIYVQDSQSDTGRAAAVTSELINDTKVDMVMCAATGDTVNPVADQCEALGVPCISTDVPLEVFVFGRGGTPDKPFKWTYNLFWGMTEEAKVEIDMFNQVPTNKKIGALWPNNAPGNAYRYSYGEGGTYWTDPSYVYIDSGPYNEPSEDFANQIALFKKEGCEILQGVMIDPDWTTLTKQCAQQGFKPKIMEGIKPTLFPTTMEAIGPLADGQCGTQWFHPTYPFKSSLTGETCQQLCDDFEATVGMQWQQTIMHYVLFEWAVDVLKRTAGLDDKEEIIKRVAETKMVDSVAGPFDFTAPVQWGTAHPVLNNVVTPTYGGQWRLTGGGKYQFELVVVSNAAAAQVKVADRLKPLTWAAS
jgi:branched-chain amino acid transport system substrate-binding protein